MQTRAIQSALASGRVSTLLGLLLAVCALVYKLRIEERWMLAHFGEKYRDYQSASWALVPFIY
jgi:protein-S-isoprenylcysteine O-methyltransferase Ste14